MFRSKRTKKAVLAFLAVDATVSVAMLALGYSHRDLLPTADKPAAVQVQATPEPSRAEVLIKEHDCWTGAAPADMEGVIPGHVVLTLKSGRTVYHGSLGVEAALQHVFDAPLPGILEVNAFCR